MTSPRHVAVIDIGKTNAKLALVDLVTLTESAVRKMPNRVLDAGPYPHFDVEALWAFILDGLTEMAATRPIDAVSITTHGVAAALVDEAGRLVLPVLDYEHDGPHATAASYDALRPPFGETGTPRLPVGLNLGAQLFWQSQAFPDAFARVKTILTYPQYWAWRLTGVTASEATFLGCHTDLWSPGARDFSSMVDALGWRRLFPPIRVASERLGPILPEIAARTGLPADTPVHCGIHDSNASLLPHLMAREAPFSVVSTGTWVIAMAVGAQPRALDPARDTLINVNAFGDPVPSARFMGGREFSTLLGSDPPVPTEAEIARVLRSGTMLLPSVEQGSGPFPGRPALWTPEEPTAPGERMTAVSFYLAMMTSVSLGLIDADGDIVVEGPFAANDLFTRMLAAATGRPVLTSASGVTGTSIGAALLARGDQPFSLPGNETGRETFTSAWQSYAKAWMTTVSTN